MKHNSVKLSEVALEDYQGSAGSSKLKAVLPACEIDFIDFLWLTYCLGKVVRGWVGSLLERS